jgi:hypothetical protein
MKNQNFGHNIKNYPCANFHESKAYKMNKNKTRGNRKLSRSAAFPKGRVTGTLGAGWARRQVSTWWRPCMKSNPSSRSLYPLIHAACTRFKPFAINHDNLVLRVEL